MTAAYSEPGIFGSIRDSMFGGSVKRDPYDMSEYSMQGPGRFIYPLLGGDPTELVKREGSKRENVKGSNFWDRLSFKQQSGLSNMGLDRGSGLKALKANLSSVNEAIENKQRTKALDLRRSLYGIETGLAKETLGVQERIGDKSNALALQLAQLSSNDARDAVIANNELQVKLAERQNQADLRNWENQVAFARENRQWEKDQAKEKLIMGLLLRGLDSIGNAFV